MLAVCLRPPGKLLFRVCNKHPLVLGEIPAAQAFRSERFKLQTGQRKCPWGVVLNPSSVARKSSLLWQPQESCAGSRPTLLSKEQSKVLSYGKMSRNPMAFFSLGFHKVENALEVPPSKGARGLENLFCPRWGMGTSGTSAKTHS